ncbi:MAG: hypothetical protein PHH93_10130, partial [Prolixibacteraceae bacterium]|nr:hypothetical protein [Prolixibacteraceae bacterium]
DYVRENGIHNMNDGNIHPVTIEISDISGNRSVLNFRVESKYKQIYRENPEFSKYFRFDESARYFDDSIRIELPKGSLYKDLPFVFKKSPTLERLISPVYSIHDKTVPLHKSARLSVRASQTNDTDLSKALLVNVDTISGNFSSAGGQYRNGWVTGEIRAFGDYAVAVDTMAPVITPLSIKNNSALTEPNRVRFRISDSLSGIKSIEGIIDDKWALFEYDAKTNMIVHYFDKERFEMNRRHSLKLIISDNKENISIYEASFYK